MAKASLQPERKAVPYRCHAEIDDAGLAVHLVRHRIGRKAAEAGPPDPYDSEPILEQLRLKRVNIDEQDRQAIERVLAAWRDDRLADNRVPVLQGTPAVHGESGRLVWTPKCDPDRPLAGDEDRPFTHYAPRLVALVAEEIIAKLVPPTPGRDGCDVFGQVRKARDGQPFTPRLGVGCRLDEQGAIRATQAGTLHVNKGLISVTEELHVRGNVDFETGHISARGSVAVDGHVADLFRLASNHDVTVRQSVYAADIRARGNVAVYGSLANRRKGACLAGGDLMVRVIDNSHAAARGDIEVAREVISSDLFAGGRLNCPRAAIRGSLAVARGGAEVRDLGAPGARTLLIAGVDWLLAAQAAPLRRQIARLDAEIRRREPALAALAEQASRLDAEQRRRLAQWQEAVEDLRHRRAELIAQIGRFAEQGRPLCKPEIIIRGEAHPGAELRLGDRRVRIEKPLRGPITFRLDPTTHPPTVLAVAGSNAHAKAVPTRRIVDPLTDIPLPEVPPNPDGETPPAPPGE